MTFFNDKATDELFMVLLQVCISFAQGCVCACVCVRACVRRGVAGVNNLEKKPFVFRG